MTDASLPAASPAVRTVQGADGPVEIPADPQRIVGDLMSLDYMSALGIDTDRFVGVFGAEFFAADHYLAEVLQRPDLVDPGFAFEANLEALAAAEPDLIIAPFDQIDGAPGLDAMREIAPVLIVPTSETRDPGVRYGGAASFQDWRTTLRHMARCSTDPPRPRRTSPRPRTSWPTCVPTTGASSTPRRRPR